MIQELADRDPENPFVTPAFAHGQTLLGYIPCLLGLWSGKELQAGCIGTFKKGRLSSSLDIRLLPDISSGSPFWPGLMEACKALRIWDLTMCSVTDRSDPVPMLGRVTFEERGAEYHLRMIDRPDPARMGSNHRRNLVKARKNGVTLCRSSSPDAIIAHVSLMNLSMERRQERGEVVTANIRSLYFRHMLAAGAGEFFQAIHPDGSVLSSIFLLRSAAGSYYQSAGTSPQGMSLGSSPFLVWRTAEFLQSEGVTCFNLGGSSLNNEGLLRFKNSFGGQAVPFHTLTFNLANPLLWRLRNSLTNLRRIFRRT
ncbi:MAG: GNAT family N-acetyltransferase [Verrucomicrobiaceae bacterium]|nr:GNAT family N-acetyltransferase [Verrucomicrobiaceae bacterium]